MPIILHTFHNMQALTGMVVEGGFLPIPNCARQVHAFAGSLAWDSCHMPSGKAAVPVITASCGERVHISEPPNQRDPPGQAKETTVIQEEGDPVQLNNVETVHIRYALAIP